MSFRSMVASLCLSLPVAHFRLMHCWIGNIPVCNALLASACRCAHLLRHVYINEIFSFKMLPLIVPNKRLLDPAPVKH